MPIEALDPCGSESKKPPRRRAPSRPGQRLRAEEVVTRTLPTDRASSYPHTEAPNASLPCEGCGGPAPSWRCYWGPRLCSACGEAATAEFEAAGGWPLAPWEVPHAPGVAVAGAGFAVIDGFDVTFSPCCFGELAAFCVRYAVRELWVHESGLEALGWPQAIEKRADPRAGQAHPFFGDLEGFESSLRPAGLAPWANYWRKGGAGFRLFVPQYGRRLRTDGTWGRPPPFAATESPWALSWALGAYHAATGGRWPWRGTGARTSDNWLVARFKGKLAPTAVAPPYAEGLAPEGDYQWVRPLRPAEERARYMLAFDVNGAYLGAAGGVSLPAGKLEHLVGPNEVDEAIPGYWRFSGLPTWEGPGPAPWWRPDELDADLWATTPAAAYLVKSFELRPVEGYFWPEHHGYLRPWYDQLRVARATAVPASGALEAVKAVYKAGLGKLASERWHPQGAADPLYQPYWDQAVTALARCNLHRRIMRLGAEPFGVSVDCLYFLTNSPSHGAFAARVGIPLGEGLGQFKPKGPRLAGAAARAELGGGRSPVGIFRALDELLEAAP